MKRSSTKIARLFNGIFPKIVSIVNLFIIHSMAHWKIVALFVLHELHRSLVYSLALILGLATVEFIFIQTTAQGSANHAATLTFIHMLTVVLYSVNIIMRGHRWDWLLIALAIIILHLIIGVYSRCGKYTFAFVSALDILFFIFVFHTIFHC